MILQHKMSIRNQMNTFIENVASKLWTEASNIRLLNDEGAVYTKEPQDIFFYATRSMFVKMRMCCDWHNGGRQFVWYNWLGMERFNLSTL